MSVDDAWLTPARHSATRDHRRDSEDVQHDVNLENGSKYDRNTHSAAVVYLLFTFVVVRACCRNVVMPIAVRESVSKMVTSSARVRVVVLNKLCERPPQYAPVPCKLTFDLQTLKVVSESRVTWATSVPILVFLGLSVLDLRPMYATDVRQTDVTQTSDAHHRLMPPA